MQDLKDQALTNTIKNLFKNNVNLNQFNLSIEVKESIAHIKGSVPAQKDIKNIRQTVGGVRNLYGLWDFIEISDGQELKVVDIGCGDNKQTPKAVGIDIIDIPEVDIVADLEEGLPLPDNFADHIFAVHILEHINNLVDLMNEVHRVLKPYGVLHVMVPNWRFVNSVADPTHVRFFSLQTFKFFCRPAYPNIHPFKPILAASSKDTVFADIQPVKEGTSPATKEDLVFFFS